MLLPGCPRGLRSSNRGPLSPYAPARQATGAPATPLGAGASGSGGRGTTTPAMVLGDAGY
eukprot:1711673-Rhodomonas_salina.3